MSYARRPWAAPPLPPLLLLLLAVAGTLARPQQPPRAIHEPVPGGNYAPDAWRPVTSGSGVGVARSAATVPAAHLHDSSFGLRIDQDRSRYSSQPYTGTSFSTTKAPMRNRRVGKLARVRNSDIGNTEMIHSTGSANDSTFSTLHIANGNGSIKHKNNESKLSFDNVSKNAKESSASVTNYDKTNDSPENKYEFFHINVNTSKPNNSPMSQNEGNYSSENVDSSNQKHIPQRIDQSTDSSSSEHSIDDRKSGEIINPNKFANPYTKGTRDSDRQILPVDRTLGTSDSVSVDLSHSDVKHYDTLHRLGNETYVLESSENKPTKGDNKLNDASKESFNRTSIINELGTKSHSSDDSETIGNITNEVPKLDDNFTLHNITKLKNKTEIISQKQTNENIFINPKQNHSNYQRGSKILPHKSDININSTYKSEMEHFEHNIQTQYKDENTAHLNDSKYYTSSPIMDTTINFTIESLKRNDTSLFSTAGPETVPKMSHEVTSQQIFPEDDNIKGNIGYQTVRKQRYRGLAVGGLQRGGISIPLEGSGNKNYDSLLNDEDVKDFQLSNDNIQINSSLTLGNNNFVESKGSKDKLLSIENEKYYSEVSERHRTSIGSRDQDLHTNKQMKRDHATDENGQHATHDIPNISSEAYGVDPVSATLTPTIELIINSNQSTVKRIIPKNSRQSLNKRRTSNKEIVSGPKIITRKNFEQHHSRALSLPEYVVRGGITVKNSPHKGRNLDSSYVLQNDAILGTDTNLTAHELISSTPVKLADLRNSGETTDNINSLNENQPTMSEFHKSRSYSSSRNNEDSSNNYSSILRHANKSQTGLSERNNDFREDIGEELTPTFFSNSKLGAKNVQISGINLLTSNDSEVPIGTPTPIPRPISKVDAKRLEIDDKRSYHWREPTKENIRAPVTAPTPIVTSNVDYSIDFPTNKQPPKTISDYEVKRFPTSESEDVDPFIESEDYASGFGGGFHDFTDISSAGIPFQKIKNDYEFVEEIPVETSNRHMNRNPRIDRANAELNEPSGLFHSLQNITGTMDNGDIADGMNRLAHNNDETNPLANQLAVTATHSDQQDLINFEETPDSDNGSGEMEINNASSLVNNENVKGGSESSNHVVSEPSSSDFKQVSTQKETVIDAIPLLLRFLERDVEFHLSHRTDSQLLVARNLVLGTAHLIAELIDSLLKINDSHVNDDNTRQKRDLKFYRMTNDDLEKRLKELAANKTAEQQNTTIATDMLQENITSTTTSSVTDSRMQLVTAKIDRVIIDPRHRAPKPVMVTKRLDVIPAVNRSHHDSRSLRPTIIMLKNNPAIKHSYQLHIHNVSDTPKILTLADFHTDKKQVNRSKYLQTTTQMKPIDQLVPKKLSFERPTIEQFIMDRPVRPTLDRPPLASVKPTAATNVRQSNTDQPTNRPNRSQTVSSTPKPLIITARTRSKWATNDNEKKGKAISHEETWMRVPIREHHIKPTKRLSDILRVLDRYDGPNTHGTTVSPYKSSTPRAKVRVKGETGNLVPWNSSEEDGSSSEKRGPVFEEVQAPEDKLELVKQFLANNLHDLTLPRGTTSRPKGTIKLIHLPTKITTSANTETKKWPGGSSGLQSLDDLIMYHTYTDDTEIRPKPSLQIVTADKPSSTKRPYIHHDPLGGADKKPVIIVVESANSQPNQVKPEYHIHHHHAPPVVAGGSNSYGAPASPSNTYGTPVTEQPVNTYQGTTPSSNGYGQQVVVSPSNTYSAPPPNNIVGVSPSNSVITSLGNTFVATPSNNYQLVTIPQPGTPPKAYSTLPPPPAYPVTPYPSNYPGTPPPPNFPSISHDVPLTGPGGDFDTFNNDVNSKPACTHIYITADISNANNISKEGCTDVNIVVHSNNTNNVEVPARRPGGLPGIQNQQTGTGTGTGTGTTTGTATNPTVTVTTTGNTNNMSTYALLAALYFKKLKLLKLIILPLLALKLAGLAFAVLLSKLKKSPPPEKQSLAVVKIPVPGPTKTVHHTKYIHLPAPSHGHSGGWDKMWAKNDQHIQVDPSDVFDRRESAEDYKGSAEDRETATLSPYSYTHNKQNILWRPKARRQKPGVPPWYTATAPTMRRRPTKPPDRGSRNNSAT